VIVLVGSFLPRVGSKTGQILGVQTIQIRVVLDATTTAVVMIRRRRI